VNTLSRLLRLLIESASVPLLALVRHRSLLYMLLQREIATRTSGTWLGRLWPLLQPSLQVAGFWFLFAVVYDMRNLRGPGYVQYLLMGMLPWLCFSEVMSRATGLFREFSALYARSPFPLVVLPGVVLLIPALVYTPVLALTTGWLLGPVAGLQALLVIPLLLVWALPLLLLCAVTGLFVRDFGQALPFLLTLLMYITPILYFPDMLPATVQQWLWLNPMADWMAVIHAALTEQSVPLPSVWRLLGLWLLLLAPSWLWFRRTLLHVRELL
jgi:lipopolysaccharide transport system permease protein